MFKCYPCGAKVSREENTKVQAIFDKIDDADLHFEWPEAPEGEDTRTSALCTELGLYHCVGEPANFDDTSSVVTCYPCLEKGVKALKLTEYLDA